MSLPADSHVHTEWSWDTADNLPGPLFAPDRPVLRDAFDPHRRPPMIS